MRWSFANLRRECRRAVRISANFQPVMTCRIQDMKRASIGAIFAFALFLALPLFGQPAHAAGPHLDKVLDIQKGLQETIARVAPSFVRVGGGSGVLISEDGYFLTNYHVAWRVFQRSETTTVTLPGGDNYIARRVGWDPLGDVTLCKLDLKEGEKVPYLEFGDSDSVEIGQMVIMLGNPFSLSNDSKPTVSLGVISAKNRYVVSGKPGQTFLYGDAIQTDAALNPGNSGGPMISLDGKLLGLNGLIFPRHGFKVNTGIGYAVSINQIKLFMKLLKENDVCYHGTINGMEFDIRPVKREPGAYIKSVARGGSAEKAGFKPGDIIRKLNDTDVTGPARFMWMLNRHPEKTTFEVTVKRGSEDVEITVTTERIPWLNRKLPLPGQPKPPPADPNRAVLGVVFDNTYTGEGAKIRTVTPNSGAARAGIEAGDIIVKVGGKEAANLEAVIASIKGKKAGDIVRMTVRRGEEEMTFDVELVKVSDLDKPKPEEKPEEEPEEKPEEKPEEEPEEEPEEKPEESPEGS